jgi:hypothetical protein
MAWYNTNWFYRKKITIGVQSGSLTNFPVYLNLANLGSDFFSNIKADGGDIRITLADEVTEVPRELVSINTGTSTGELYFRADNLSNSTTTDFYIYFGNASATNPAKNATFGAYNVWNSIYRIVYHFNEYTPAGNIATGTNFINSASNGFSASVLGTPAITSLNDGPIGKSLDVDGTNYYLTVADPTDLTEYTFSTYIKPTTTNGAITVKNSGTDNSNASFSENLRITSSKFEHYYFDGATANLPANSTFTLGSYFHVVGTAKNGGTGYIYQNGSQQTATDSTGTLWTGGDTFNLFGRDGSKANWFLGQVEEFRIAPVQLSAAWILSEYNNLSSPSTFYDISLIQTQNPPQIEALTPAIGSTGNAANTNLVLDFDQNVSVGTGNVTIEQIPNLNIGGTFQGDLAELMMLNTLTDSDRQKIEGYLAWKWFGGNNNLPSNHPYKLYAPRN